jgi:energy-coupling factor transporter ATP-binding protein EcfA2
MPTQQPVTFHQTDEAEPIARNASFLKTLFKRLEEECVHYVVLRNYETLPYPSGGDLDILVAPDHAEAFKQCCSEACNESSALLHHFAEKRNGAKINALFTFDIKDSQHARLELHVQFWISCETSILAQRVKGVSYKVFLRDITPRLTEQGEFRFRIPSPSDEFVLLYRQWVFRGKEKYRHRMLEILQESSDAPNVSQLISKVNSGRLRLDAATSTDDRKKSLRSLVIEQWGKDSFKRYLRAYSTRRSRQLFQPRKLLIYLSGPDGAGKTTLANTLSAMMHAGKIKHRRLYSMKRNVLRNAMVRWHEKKGEKKREWYPLLIEDIEDRDTGSYFWRIRKRFNLLVSLLDVGVCFAVVTCMRLNGNAVIVETSPYEIFIKYHMPCFRWTEQFACKVLPKPNFGLLLMANADAIHKRKDELLPTEIEDYYARIESIIATNNLRGIFHAVKTDGDPDSTTSEIFKILIAENNCK